MPASASAMRIGGVDFPEPLLNALRDGRWWCLLALACPWGRRPGCPQAFVSWLSVWKTASDGRGVGNISRKMSVRHTLPGS